MKLIVARDINNGIGINNTLPWKCKEDLKWFKSCTENKTVVMGRNTFESLDKKPLPNRFNIVITSTPELYKHLSSDVLVFMTLNDYLTSVVSKEHWLIGGASLYVTLLPYVQEIFVTTINGEYECDTHLDINFNKTFLEMSQFKLTDDVYVTNYWRKDDE